MLEIYVDGGCSPNPGTGGYGVVFVYNNRCKQYNGRVFKTTNNLMEMEAVRIALLVLNEQIKFFETKYKTHISKIVIYTDSAYVHGGLTGWGVAHRNNGWSSKHAKQIKNKDQWIEIHSLMQQHKGKNIKFVKVKGHSGNKGNDMADKLATDAINGSIIDRKIAQ